MKALTAAELDADARRQCSQSRDRQGLPPTVEDPGVLGRLAAIFRAGDTKTAERAAS